MRLLVANDVRVSDLARLRDLLLVLALWPPPLLRLLLLLLGLLVGVDLLSLLARSALRSSVASQALVDSDLLSVLLGRLFLLLRRLASAIFLGRLAS